MFNRPRLQQLQKRECELFKTQSCASLFFYIPLLLFFFGILLSVSVPDSQSPVIIVLVLNTSPWQKYVNQNTEIGNVGIQKVRGL